MLNDHVDLLNEQIIAQNDRWRFADYNDDELQKLCELINQLRHISYIDHIPLSQQVKDIIINVIESLDKELLNEWIES